MIKKMGSIAAVVWIFGAFISGLAHYYELKQDCIESEGWIKGWLMCSQETRSSFTRSMLKGAAWPARVFHDSSPDDPTEGLTENETMLSGMGYLVCRELFRDAGVSSHEAPLTYMIDLHAAKSPKFRELLIKHPLPISEPSDAPFTGIDTGKIIASVNTCLNEIETAREFYQRAH